MSKEIQTELPGLEGYVCTFKCLTHCPLAPDGGCYYDDPDMGKEDQIEYPEFFWWRFEQIFGNSDEFLEITPDMMEEYFKEPADPLQTRCPRCFSTEFIVGYPYIECTNCGYNEPVIDFSENIGRNNYNNQP